MAVVNLGLRFLIELGGLAAVGYWGLQASSSPVLGVVVGLGAAGLLSIVWALVVAPKASNGLSQETRTNIGTGLLLLAAAALGIAGGSGLGLAFGAAVLVNAALLMVFRDGVAALGAGVATHTRGSHKVGQGS